MKPVKLFLKNVGPFHEEKIDFSKLGGLFLITGETGSGKTFIFDAMTYALYDTTCGTRGTLNNNMLISRKRKQDEDSFVEFTFDVSGVYYKVTRYLEKVSRPTTIKAILEVSYDSGATFEVKSEKAEVKKDILEILKLTADEFSKIVLLPQGQFEEFLTSSSDKKKEILKKMFNVEKFTRIGEYIKTQEKKYADELSSLDELNEQVSHGRKIDELEAELEAGQKSIADLTSEEKKLNRKITSISLHQKSLNDEKNAAEKKAQCKNELEAEKKKSSEIYSLEKILENAKKADSLSVFLKDKQKAAFNFEERKKELRNAEEKFSKAQKDFELSLVSFNEIPKMEEEANVLSVEISALTEKLNKAKEFEIINKIYEDVQKSSQLLKSEHEKAEKSLSELKKMLPEGKNIDEYLISLLSQKNDLEGILKETEKKLKDSLLFEKLSSEISELEVKIRECTLLKTQNEALLEKKSKQLETAKTQSKIASLMSQASLLAAKLEEGIPCPVCGSKNHPHPAVNEFSFDYGKQIEDLEKEIKSIEKKNSENELELNSLKIKLEENKKAAAELGECISSMEAEKNLKENQQKYEECVKKYDDTEKLKEKINLLEDEIKSSVDKLNDAEKKLAQTETEWKLAKKDLGDELSFTAIEEKVSVASAKYDEIVKKIADSRKLHSDCSTSKAECSAYLESSAKALKAAETDFENAENVFLSKLSENKEFADEKAVEKALVSLQEQKKMQTEISVHHENLVRLETLLSSFGETREIDAVEKELEESSALKETLSAEFEKISSQLMELNGKCVLLESSIRDYKKNSEKIADIQKKHRCYQYLKQKFSYKTQLDAWALGAYYSRIVDFASQRFEKLSGGRYRLKQNLDFTSGRANSDTSLDLLVEDTYFGQYSGIASLSGGERFEASLSLALALTDSVKSRKGGIELDSIFIDEGFGTLDAKTRNLIKPVLNDLQINQKKTVGIISHVEAFQEEIHDQIQLEKEDGETHVKIVKK
ncbi:MAG: SMC family ATPase [Treponema sp.]|nr:SMC family ATPase [Treponema sp.]